MTLYRYVLGSESEAGSHSSAQVEVSLHQEELKLDTDDRDCMAMMVGPAEGICLLRDEKLLVFSKNAKNPV